MTSPVVRAMGGVPSRIISAAGKVDPSLPSLLQHPDLEVAAPRQATPKSAPTSTGPAASQSMLQALQCVGRIMQHVRISRNEYL